MDNMLETDVLYSSQIFIHIKNYNRLTAANDAYFVKNLLLNFFYLYFHKNFLNDKSIHLDIYESKIHFLFFNFLNFKFINYFIKFLE